MIWHRNVPTASLTSRTRSVPTTATMAAVAGAAGMLLAGCGGAANAESPLPEVPSTAPSSIAPSTAPTPTSPSSSTTSPSTAPTNPSTTKAPAVDCSQAKCIALTFDDGPGPYTARLLDTLKQEHVPATFFLVGERVAQYADIVKREAAEGHEIGNHSWDHRDLATLTSAEIQQEIDKTSDAVVAAGAPRPTLLRPPYGSVDATVEQTARMPFVMWRVDPDDWKYQNAETVARNIVEGAKVGRIVLSHDIYQSTVDAVPSVIEQLRARGYTFVTVSDLMAGANMQDGRSYFNRPPSLDPPSSLS